MEYVSLASDVLLNYERRSECTYRLNRFQARAYKPLVIQPGISATHLQICTTIVNDELSSTKSLAKERSLESSTSAERQSVSQTYRSDTTR